EEFRLDALGNRVWQRDLGLNSEYNDRCRNHSIDGLGRLTQITLDLINCPPPPPSYAYEHNMWYDGAGNVSATFGRHNVGEGLVHNQALSYYDADDKLRVFNTYDVGAVYEQYRYDALGRRVLVRSRSTDGTGFGYIERTVWDGAQILSEIRAMGGDSASGGEMESDNPVGYGQYAGKLGRIGYSHAGGIDRPVTVFRDGVAVVPYVDWRGTPAMGSYMDGTATSGACPPFPAGRTTVDGEKSAEPCTEWWGSLIGAQTDGSGLEYMRNRYYDPRTGRFTQEDPIGLAGGLNLYGFANGDPVNFSDPFGLTADTTKGKLQVLKEQAIDVLCSLAVCNKVDTDKFAAAAVDGAISLGLLDGGPGQPRSGEAGGPGASKRFSRGTQDDIVRRDGTRCVFCGDETTTTPGPRQRNIDHAIPIAGGGNNTPNNGQVTCRTCNLAKWARSTIEFLRRLRLR
ncbi:MAG TPA: RHS repeat-associated core domain-containing protein, partial [Gemmatimonadales bacterium]|nr:RHS repeat-associated core domain-containing protein [Gemmatimonadales bacterium]